MAFAGGFVPVGLFLYAVVAILWLVVTFACARKSVGLQNTNKPVARLYTFLTVGSVCAVGMAVYKGFALFGQAGIGGVYSSKIVNPVADVFVALLSNMGGLILYYFSAIRGWLPRIAQEQAEQQNRAEALRQTIRERTADLQSANERLSAELAERSRIEEALQREHSLLSAMMNTGVGAICVADAEGQIVYINDAALGLLDQADDVGMRDIRSIAALSDLDGRPIPEHEMPFNRIMRGGAALRDMKYRILLRNGGERILRLDVTPVCDERKRTSRVIFVFRDVTQDVQEDNNLRDNERRFRSIIENLPSGAVYIDGEHIHMNRAAEEITGYSRAEISTVNQWFWALYGEESATARAKYESIRDAGFNETCRGAITRKSGESRIIECNGYKSGQTTVWLLHDITERAQAEEALRDSEAKYRTLAETARDMICVHDLEGNFSYSNATAKRFAELIAGNEGKFDVCRFLTPASKDRILTQRERRLDGDRSRWLFEIEAITHDGLRIPLEVSTAPIDVNGKVTGILSIIRDISDRKRAEEERRRLEAQAFQSQKHESLVVLAAGVAHDFNNALMGIIGGADLALHDLPAQSGCRRHLDEISENAAHAAELCRLLLAYTGEGELHLEPVDVNATLSEMARFLQGGASVSIPVTCEFANSLDLINADPLQIRQLFLILLTNAYEATVGNDGAIALTTESKHLDDPFFATAYPSEGLRAGEYVNITISDSGCGMDNETADRMFDPFFTTKPNARGLGLSKALGIVRAHGGTMKTYSVEGQGTTVNVYFPVAAVDARKAELTGAPEALWHGSGTVLVVDDEVNVRHITRRMLEKMGFQVKLASDGQEAIDAIESDSEFAAVILDLSMPNMDGDFAYREIRRTHPGLPVLIATGYDVKTITNRFAERGISSFIQKPYRLEVLSSHLREALSGPRSGDRS